MEQGLTVASKLDDSLQCFFCLAIGSAEIEVKLCSGCGVAKYCSKSCQKKAWADHSVICKAIQQLSVPKQTSLEFDKFFPTNLNPHQRNNIAKLVGNMCLINCTFDGKQIQALFDTGAQVSIISSKTLRELLPKKEIKDISCLLGSETLNLTVANGEKLPYDGYIEIDFTLRGEGGTQFSIPVPVLVTPHFLEHPIIGYNVVEEILVNHKDRTPVLIKLLAESLNASTKENVEKFVNLVQKGEEKISIPVKLSKGTFLIKSGQSAKVPWRVNIGPISSKSPFIFEPTTDIKQWAPTLEISDSIINIKNTTARIQITIHNAGSHDIVLKGRTLIGSLEPIRSVTPLEVKLRSDDKRKESNDEQKQVIHSIGSTEGSTIVDDLKLNNLDEEKTNTVMEMLADEQSVFARSSDDVGDIPSLQLDINLTDDIPVQKSYVSVPRPLYNEVKMYVQDLLNREFIRKSTSAYSSPVVCVSKCDGSLRLCIALTTGP